MGQICEKCKTDKGFERYSSGSNICDDCERLENRIASPEKYVMSIGVGKRHSVCNIDNFNGSEHDHVTPKIDKDFGENILIQSKNVGNGKTHLAIAILKIFGSQNGGVNKFVNFSNLMLDIKSTFNDSKDHTEHEIIKKYCSYEMLVIDDIGAEKASDYNMSVLYIILNNRYEAAKPTVITTNMSGEDIVSQYGKRILSRLRSGYLVTLNSKDKRGLK